MLLRSAVKIFTQDFSSCQQLLCTPKLAVLWLGRAGLICLGNEAEVSLLHEERDSSRRGKSEESLAVSRVKCLQIDGSIVLQEALCRS